MKKPYNLTKKNYLKHTLGVSSEYQRKKLAETVSSGRKKPWKKPRFFLLWKKLVNPVCGHNIYVLDEPLPPSWIDHTLKMIRLRLFLTFTL